MNNNKGRQEYGIFLDNDDLKRKAMESKAIFAGIGDKATVESARLENVYKRAGQTIATLGSAFAVGTLAKELYSFANAFDKSMKEVSTLSNTVSNDLDGFKQSVLGMTTDIPIGADAAAKALYQIVSAGHDGANGMHVLEVASKAAIGGVTETVTAADAITTLLNAYKLNAQDATSISDQLFTTVRLGKTTFGELGHHIAQVAPIAASFGIETEQVLAAVATLTKSGTPTAQAMTQIRSAIVESTKVLGDGYFATHTFQEGLSEISNMANGSESEMRKLIPSIEAMTGVLGLTGINAKMAASDLGELGNSLGASEQAFKKMNNTADAQLTLLKNKMLAKFHEIGNGAVDMVGSVAKFLNEDGVFSDSALDDLIATMGVLIVTVGTYKASLMATNAIKSVGQNLKYTTEIAELEKLLLVKKKGQNQDLQDLVTSKKLTADQANKIAMLRAEIQAKLDGIKADVAKANTEVGNAKATLVAQGHALSASKAKIISLRLEQSEHIVTGNSAKANSLQEKIYAERKEYSAIKTGIKTQQDKINTLQLDAQTKNLALNNFQQKANNITTLSGAKAKGIMTIATKRLGTAFKGLGKAFMANPFGLVLTAVTMAVSAFMMFRKETEDVADTTETLTNKTRELTSAIEDLSASKYLQTKSFEELKKLYPDTLKNMTLENYLLADKTALLKQMNEEKEKETFKKQDQNLTDAKKNLARLEKKYKVDKTTGEAEDGDVLGIGATSIAIARNTLKSVEKIVNDRDAILKKAAELPKAPVPIEMQIVSLDKNIETLKKDLSKLDKILFDRKTASGGMLLIDNINTEPAKINPWELDFTIDPEIQARQKNAELKKAKEQKALLEASKPKTNTSKELSDDQKKILEEINKELLSLEESNEIERQDRKIALMAEGSNKEIAQINLDYERKIAATEVMIKKWKDAQDGKLTFDQKVVIFNAETGYQDDRDTDTATVKTNQTKEEKERNDEVLKNFASFKDRYKELADEHDKNKADISKAGGDTDNQDVAEEQYQEKLTALNEEVVNNIDGFEELANQITDANVQKIIDLLKKSKEAMIKDGKGADSKEVKAVDAEIKKFEELKIPSSKRSLKEWQDMEEQLNDCIGAFEEIGDAIGGTAGEIIKTAGQIATSTTSMVSGILQFVDISMASTTVAATGAAAAIKTVEKASVILAIIGAAMQIMTALFSNKAEKEHEEALLKVTEEKLDMQRTYNALLREQNALLAKGETIFGSKYFSEGVGYVDTYRGALDDLKKEMTGEMPKMNFFERISGDALGTYQEDLDNYKKGIAGLADIEIKTGSYTTGKWFWKKQHDVMTSALDVYPDLIDAEGNLDKVRAEAILSSHEMSDTDKERLETLLSLTEEAEEAMQSLKDHIGSVWGDLGNDMTTSIVNAVENGENAMDAFKNSITDKFKQLGQELMYQLHFAEMFEDLEKDLVGTYTGGETDPSKIADEQMDIVDDFFNSMGGQVDKAQDFYKNFLDKMEESGYSVEEDTREASAKGIATASQESVDENNGRLTAIQGHTYELNEGVKSLTGYAHSFKESFSWLQSNAAIQLKTLQGIETNTSPIAAIHEEMASMRSTLEDIKDQGLKMKR